MTEQRPAGEDSRPAKAAKAQPAAAPTPAYRRLLPAPAASTGPSEGHLVSPERRERYRSRFFRVWGYIGIAVIAVGVCWLLGHIWDALTVLAAGAIMAFIYAPITNWLHRRFGMPRLPATLLGLLALVLVVLLLIGSIIPLVVSQVSSLLNAFPEYLETLQSWADQIGDYIGSQKEGQLQSLLAMVIDSLSAQATNLGSQIASSATSDFISSITDVVHFIVNLFMALVISFWLTKDFPSIESDLSKVVGPRRGEDYRIITTVFSRSLGGYLKGLIINSACTGTIAGIGFWILGVPYSLILGIITAFLNIIPYIGPWVGGILAFLVALSANPWAAILSIVVTVVAQQFTDNFISPKVMQQAVSLHPALVIVALIAGGAVGGIIGMILAVPLMAAIKGVFIYYYEKKTGRQLVSRDGAIFRGEPFCDEEGNPRPACDALGVDQMADDSMPEDLREAMVASSAGEAGESEDGEYGGEARQNQGKARRRLHRRP